MVNEYVPTSGEGRRQAESPCLNADATAGVPLIRECTQSLINAVGSLGFGSGNSVRHAGLTETFFVRLAAAFSASCLTRSLTMRSISA